MDITTIVSTDYVEFDAETPVSKARGAFEDPTLKAVLVTRDGEFDGVVTRRQLATSHRQPREKLGSLVWHVPTVSPREDVREVAQLMLDSDSRVLPVFEGETMEGVVTADDLLEAVQSALDAATVDDAASRDLVTVAPDTTFGRAVNLIRERRITHLPVVDETAIVGMLSLYDLTDIAARAMTRSQGGNPGDGDAAGGRGGFGAREGELDSMRDLPVRDVMATPVRTIEPDATLDVAVSEMFAVGGSSLVVTDEDGTPSGIVTKTDVLEALTWEAEGHRAVQLSGADLLDDMSYEDVVAQFDRFDEFDGTMRVLDAKVHLHEHNETLRGTPLLLARIRLSTDRGLFIGTGEGYGASSAIATARDVIERRILDDKTYGRTKKHPDEEFWEKRFGWTLEA